jgi:hypothetical protein
MGDNVLRNAARGAALIGIAVVIGIVLLQVVDKGSPGGTGGGTGSPTVATNGTGNGTTTLAADVHPPQEDRELVLNGSGISMQAAVEANKLLGLGYAGAGTGNAPTQAGNTVQCRADFDKEATLLAKAVGTGTSISAFPDAPPAGAENADCIVTVGTS